MSSRPPGRLWAVCLVAVVIQVLAAAGPVDVAGQEIVPVDSVAEPSDSAATPAAQPATSVTAADSTRDRPPSPLGALARSIVLPGWGQFSLGHPVRGTLYALGETAALVMVFTRQSRLDDARAAMPPDSALIARRSQAREDWIVGAAFLALISGIDAWVSAHFWGFEGDVVQPPEGALGMAFRVRVPLRGP